MKYAILFILLLGIVATACKDEMFTGQTPVDGVAPLQIKNPEVINVEGGALITYDLPDDEDLLYVEAKYKRNSGEVAIAQASVYTDTLKIEGLGDTTRREVQITTVDRSFNRSAAIGVDVRPLTPPFESVFASLDAQQTVGGIDMTWNNPKEINVIISVLKQEPDGVYLPLEMIYSSAAKGKYAIRNQEAVQSNYAFCLRDKWDNRTDTIYKTLTPLYEEKMKLTHYPMVSTTPVIYGWVHDNLFDGDKSTCNHTSESQLPIPHQFSFKSEVPVKLRHIRIFHRDIWPFRDATPRVFEIWATNSLPNPDGSDDGWVLLNTFTSEKPSGLPMGQETQDDINVATKTGEEFTCFVDEEYQYFRFKLIDSYDGQPRMCFAELEIYGEPHGYVAEEEADDTEQ